MSKSSRRTIIIIAFRGADVLVRYPNKTSVWRGVEEIKRLYSVV